MFVAVLSPCFGEFSEPILEHVTEQPEHHLSLHIVARNKIISQQRLHIDTNVKCHVFLTSSTSRQDLAQAISPEEKLIQSNLQ